MLDRSRSRDRSKTGDPFSPVGLFVSGAQGAWYDPSDFSTLYSSSTGGEPFRTEARRNLLLRSEEFDNAGWGKDNATVTANAAVAPDGTTTADNLVEAADVGLAHYTEQQVTKVASSITYTASIFVKRASGTRNLQLRVDTGSFTNSVICAFDLGAVTANLVSSAGTFTSVSTSITALSNGWYRCVSVVTTGSETTVRARANLLNGTSQGYDGDGTSGLYLWGAQLELGSTATTYQRVGAAYDYIESPVGLMLDRSRGLVLGSELVTNGDFSAGATGWTVPAGWAITGGQAVASATSASLFGGSMTTVSGRWYRVEFDVVSYTSGNLAITVGANYSGQVVLVGPVTVGRKSILVLGGASTTRGVEFYGGTVSATIDNISVRELPGNHATQATSASRPVLRARYNLLTYSEQFDDGAWTKAGATVTANAAVAPNGTTTADKVAESTTTSVVKYIYTTSGIAVVGGSFVGTVYAKAAERSRLVMGIYNGSNYQLCQFDLIAGTVVQEAAAGIASIQDAGNGWWRCQVTRTIGATTTYLSIGPFENSNIITLTGSFPAYTGIIGDGILICGAQLQTAADEAATGGAYQRIAAATDYDVSNPVWRPYLAFDGVDDFMSLASAIPITTDMTVVRGFGRSAAGIRSAGLGPASGTEPRDYFWQTTNIESYGLGATAQTLTADTATGYFVGTLRRSATDEFLRRNGTQISTRAAPAVSGSFTKLGDLSGNLNNGPIYGLIVLDRELTGSELTATEQWMAGKTGVTI